MKRILAAFLMVVPFALGAQNESILSAYATKLASNSLSFDYSFEVKSDVTVTGNGRASLSGASYHMEGNGMEIWCDGSTRWTLDVSAKEAYIESVADDSSNYLDNPVMLLAGLDKAFKVNGVRTASFGGETVKAVDMVPSVEGTDLETVVLYVSGVTPKGAKLTVGDGTSTIFRLSKVTWTPGTDKVYAFDISTLDNSYLVTDLR